MFSRRRRMARSFEAAKMSRLLNDWTTFSQSLDFDIKAGLTTLRSRSRDLCQNNDYGRKFMHLLAVNVVGADGIRLQAKVKKSDAAGNADLDTGANAKIEAAWKKFCKKQNCSVSGRHSMTDIQRLAVQSLARDGEFIIRKIKGFDNDFAFALQLVEPDYLDHNFNDEARKIKMGVELNRWKQPTAYHLLKKHPGDSQFASAGQKYSRVPAKEIIHGFFAERCEQTRGFPWTATALRRLHMLGHYEESELVASRVGAGKMGFFVNPDGSSYSYDDKDADGNLITEVAPGKFEQLPQGWDFKSFDIDHPNTGFGGFVKAILKGAASGLNVSYISLANDPGSANFSSARQGLLEDRDYWKMLQGFMIEHLVSDIFAEWLPQAIATGEIRLPLRDLERWQRVIWHGRRWSWIDPQKDMTANEKAVALGINSRSRIAYEYGNDIEDVFDELAAEKEKMSNMGLAAANNDNDNSNKQENNHAGKNDQDRNAAARVHILTR